MNKRALVAGLALTLILGCERYQLVEDKKGSLVRLDKFLGDMVLLQGDRLKNVMTAKEQDEMLQSLSTVKTLGEIKTENLGGTCTLKTLWRQGNLFYQFTIKPLSPKVKKARDGYGKWFSVELLDSNGFKVRAIRIPIDDMTQLVDDKDKPMGLDMKDSMACSEDDYQTISDWTISWSI